MEHILLFLVVLLCFSWQCQCLRQAEFLKTKVISDTFESTKMGELQTTNYKMCLFQCVERSECRRALYCQNINPSNCFLYDEGENCLTSSGNEINCKCYNKVYNCNETGCSCPKGYYGDKCKSVVKDCIEASDKGFDTGKYKLVFIQPTTSILPFEVQCRSGGARILSRQIYSGLPVNFNRTLNEYEEGFGNRETEYWIGLKKIREILRIGEYDKLKIGFFNGSYSNSKQAHYKHVSFGNKTTGYAFSSSAYIGDRSTAPDIMLGSVNALDQPFSTFDNDSTGHACAANFGGGWWFDNDPYCSLANINGPRFALSYGPYGKIIDLQIEIYK
ncbi:hypothetical protein LOTGIDRAFT_168270 [Lottia gigantea]|uniref:Fibrinogen C-terminal domain-containing protein n=1 Tax=Lottia gigantea TaxID=225164 RepID=V3Z322_LOTGI|nr:hypothetical protein LOTGIDRAFT_168270 [Lottia gigantea]ESO85008.1 hypothetical protein LOTGIDRAFT_168270 [Lottia gigantea]